MSSSASVNPAATSTPEYRLRSEIAMACLPSSQRDPGRRVMWVNAVCAFFLATGVIGIKAPLNLVLRRAVVEEAPIVPVDFTPPPVSNQTPQEQQDTPREALPDVAPPAVVQPVAVGADESLVPFAVPTVGPTVVVLRPQAASAPPARPVVTAPPAPAVNTGPRNFRAGEGSNEGIFAPQPEYPADARRKGIEGTVKLEIEVNDDGSVGEVRKLVPSGSFVLDNNTISWVKRRWKFPPGKKLILHTEFVYQMAAQR
jgi:protein TonB